MCLKTQLDDVKASVNALFKRIKLKRIKNKMKNATTLSMYSQSKTTKKKETPLFISIQIIV